MIAVAHREVGADRDELGDVEHDLDFDGFLVFSDNPKADAAASLVRLGDLGITVKVITGDSAEVATKVCRDLGMTVTGALTGEQVEQMSDDELARQ